MSNYWAKKEARMRRASESTPKELDTIADVVLRYRPPEKVKATKKRAKRKAQRDAKKG